MVERCRVHSRLLLNIHRLHQIDFNLERALPHRANVLINIFAFAPETAGELETEHLNPEFLQPGLIAATDGNLLDSQHLEGPVPSLCLSKGSHG
jgi:hypothetical protein